MTIIIFATGQQVRCILWVQVAIFNKGIAFYVDLNYLHWIYSVKILTAKSMFDVANMIKKIIVKDTSMNNYDLLNIQACSFLNFCKRGCTQSRVVSCKYYIVIPISTGVSSYSNVILLTYFFANSLWGHNASRHSVSSSTVKPVCNDHLYDKIH